jgi:hypothetical protein
MRLRSILEGILVGNENHFYEKKTLKGVGAEHPLLTSAAYICECEHSHLHASLFSARHCCRATPFKEKKSSFRGRKKAKPEKEPPDPDFFIKNLRIIELL